jgi:NAD(P)-dependent dehydrogenase (short-subunit alcohol dehydrogenase family)
MVPRNVLVTGGSRGIGRATVLRFAQAGHHVWFTYLTGRDQAETLLAEVRELGRGTAAAVEFSQGDWRSHERLLAALPERIDILVNNSGVGSKTVERYVDGPEHVRDEAFLRINSVGPLWLYRKLLPGMLAAGYGKVIHVSSVGGGVTQFPGFQVADGMSKAALAYLTRHTAAELAHTPVDVFAVCPGAVDTDMFQQSTLAKLDPARRRELTARLPGGRLIRPEEVAALICWLCHDDARLLRGAVLDASMGLGCHPGLLTGGPPPEASSAMAGAGASPGVD